jgi:predicted amidohydrolase
MTHEVVISAIQLPAFPKGKSVKEIKSFNLQVAEYWLDQAGKSQADIACLGEGFNLRGVTYDATNIGSLVRNDLNQIVERFGKIARKNGMYIIAPIITDFEKTIRNMAVVLDRDGEYLGNYQKVHCTEQERMQGIVPGKDWPVFDLDFGVIGIEICHDNSFPESARILSLKGAEIIFWPHLMSGWGESFMDILLRAPAIYNGISFVPVCFGCDPEIAWQPGEMMIGRSSIVRPDGTLAADAGHYIGAAIAKVNLNQPRVAQGFTRPGDYVWKIDMFNDRRPDTYEIITESGVKTNPIPGNDLGRYGSARRSLYKNFQNNGSY